MKLSNTIMSVFMIMCLVSAACAAPYAESPNTTNNTTTPQGYIPAPDGKNAHKATGPSASTIVTANSDVSKATNAAVSNAAVSNAVSFTPPSSSGVCLDNTKKIAVYMPDITNPMYFEHVGGGTTGNIRVAYDPMTTAMLFEYNPDYLGDSTISSRLTTANYGVLIVPTTEMSTSAATAITNYVANGGSVWFLNDPCMTPTYGSSIQLTSILGSGTASSIGSSTIAVVNTDPITAGLPASFVPVGTASKTAEFRILPAMSGTLTNGFNYQVLMGTSARAMLVKFENPTTGARIIYSNPNMFISGGTASYFNAVTATKLFIQTKAWVMKFAQNPSGIEITYPNGDKQLTVTSDDEECADWDVAITPMINAETALGIDPASVNTFFLIPSQYFTAAKVNYYSQYGDTHNIHPHLYSGTWSEADWDNSARSVATNVASFASLKTFVNGIMGSSNYGFTSYRFPYTTYCANSMQAVSDSGFVIDSSSGCDSPATGTQIDNTLLLPKATLVNNVKTNTIQFELPASFDVNYATGAEFAAAYNANSNQFKNGNFPMNFVIGGHYQGMATNCGVPGWGVTSTGLTSGLTTILKAQQGANTNYATFNTLANYFTGVKSASITANYDGVSSTTVTVTNSKPITGFTLKVGVGSVNSVTCDGASIATKTDSTTGAIYVTKDLSAGTHSFVINTTPVTPTPTIPTVNFIPVSSTIASGASVNFVATVTGSPTPTVTWIFGDGASGAGTAVSHQFTNTGNTAITRTVVATATNSAGSTIFQGSVVVNPIAAQNSAQYVSDTIPSAMTTGQQYTASVTMRNSGTTTWNEGSMIRLGGVGDNIGDANKFGPTRIYIPAGTNIAPGSQYTFTFTMTAPATGTYNPKYQMVKDGVEWFGATLSKTITVSGGIVTPTKPTITIAPLSSSIVSGTSVVFTATVGGTPAPTVTWNFGDGTATTTGTTVSHQFTRTGTTSITRTVTATATNSAGSTATTAKVIVSPNTGANTIPTITITPTTATIAAGSSVTFTATVGGKPIPTVTWKFGDSTASVTGATATHVFTNAGSTVLTRTVTATAKNSVGSASKTAKITVNPSGGTSYTKPAAYFTCSATSGTTATTFTFTPDCDNNPTSFLWTFGDGFTQTTTTATPVTHKYTKAGSFMVRLDASNPAGTDYDDKTVTVK